MPCNLSPGFQSPIYPSLDFQSEVSEIYIHLITWKLFHCCCLVAKSCPTLCNPMNCSTQGFRVLHYLPECAQTHVHSVGDAIQPSLSMLLPSPPALNLSHHQGLFQWVSSYQVAKVLERQLQDQSSNEYSGLISLRIDWFDLLAVQGTLKSLL